MAMAIKDTPILYGKDAMKFNKAIKENECKKISDHERQKLKESFANVASNNIVGTNTTLRTVYSDELFDFRTQMVDKLKLFVEPMNTYYEIFKKIDESPQSYINFSSVMELGKALGIPSLFAILSALLL